MCDNLCLIPLSNVGFPQNDFFFFFFISVAEQTDKWGDYIV